MKIICIKGKKIIKENYYKFKIEFDQINSIPEFSKTAQEFNKKFEDSLN